MYLSRETKAACNSRHNSADQVVQVTIGGGGELESAEANIIQSLVINAHNLISVLNKLVNREGSIVWLNNSVGHLGGGHDRESAHHTVRVLLTDLGDKEGSHTRSCTSSKGVADLESLQAVTALSLLSDDIED